MGDLQQILAPGDQGNILYGIIDHHGKMIGRGNIFAGQHNIAEDLRLGHHCASQSVGPSKRSSHVAGLGDIQPQTTGLASFHAVLLLGWA